MKNWEIDVAVLLIFFCRDEIFEKVFNEVKKARPRVLFLYQDGAREGKNDLEGIMRCRKIAEDIDWDCTVYKFYQEKNVGCDPSEFIAQKWAFSIVDKCIVIEDDDVPSQSFFRFCKELLDYYENDERVNMICGMNNNDVTEYVDDSYLFTQRGAITGWASWRRVIDTWDETYSILDDEKAMALIGKNFNNKKKFKRYVEVCKKHRDSGRAHYESLLSLSMYSNNRLNIVPKYNMISNIGFGSVTTHGTDDIRKLPRAIRKIFYKKVYEIEFPLKHPKYVIRNIDFENDMQLTFSQRIIALFESTWLRIRYGGTTELKKMLSAIPRKIGLKK